MAGHILPYRADPAELRRFLVALARGRGAAELREREFSPKSYEGVATSAEVLGLSEGKEGPCTKLGQRFARAQGEEQRAVARDVIRNYPPYDGALCELADGAVETTLVDLERWWADHGFGSSDSNRSEAASIFARFVAAAGVGRYVQGRKGKVSRIVWTGVQPGPETPVARSTRNGDLPRAREPAGQLGNASGARLGKAADPPLRGEVQAIPREGLDRAGAEVPRRTEGSGQNRLEWDLGPGRRVLLELPAGLSPGEKERLLRLMELLLRD
jgi:hypothetical protein